MMQNKRIQPLIGSLILYFIGFFLYKGSHGNLVMVIPGALLMLAGLIMNVIFMVKVFKDVFNKKN